jgi:hypothetical protein
MFDFPVAIRTSTREELLVFHRAPPLVAERGMFTRYGGCRGKKNTRGRPKLALLPCSLILAYQRLEEDKKPIGNTLDRCNLRRHNY